MLNSGIKISRSPDGRYLKILTTDKKFNPYMLMGWRQRKGDPTIYAEDNLVNRIVLGMPSGLEDIHIGDPDLSSLLDYQARDVARLLGLRHSLNANPMGLGKTPETVVLLRESKVKSALIVTPKIIRCQWQDQLVNWGNIPSTIYEGQDFVDQGVWIINYDRLRDERTRMKFKRFQWQFLVLDEAHKIKNRDSKQTLAVKDIPAARRLALTGTPILRYVDDLWSILNFLDPWYSGSSYWSFVNYFCQVQKNSWGTKIIGLTANKHRREILNKLLSLVSVRNNAVEVAHGKMIEVVKVPMTKKQRELYRKEKQLLLDELPDNLTIANGAVLSLRLMQTTSWPGLFLFEMPGPKFEWILEQCINNPKEKFVVFSVFEQTVSALVKYLADNNVEAVKITGKQDDEENQISKVQFINGTAQVIAGTIGAMGQGYDGLQQVCWIMIFIDRDWSPEIMAQAEDRLHRMGQNNPVKIYYLECTGSFDQYVGRINQTKAEDIRAALKRSEEDG